MVLLGVGGSIVLQLRRPQAQSDSRDWTKDIAKLEKELEVERADHNKLAGANKQMFAELTQAKAKMDSMERERDTLQKTVTKFETSREQQDKERQREISELKAAQEALLNERKLLIEEEQERQQTAEEERDRLWNDHENTVIATMLDLCKLPHLQFTAYTNNNLPEDFDGSLKPDFLVEFLDQYVIFDAKVSKAASLQTYIDDAVKKTADKLKKNSKIYPHVFLVVPTEAISELKKLIFAKDQYYFYVVSREALAPILASLKRISTYELAETLDPQKRENIINMLAEMATHISYRNAHEILLAKMGTAALERVEQMDPDIAADVAQKQVEKKLSQLSPSELKRLASSLTEQNVAMQQLASPKVAVKKQMIDAAQSVIAQSLL